MKYIGTVLLIDLCAHLAIICSVCLVLLLGVLFGCGQEVFNEITTGTNLIIGEKILLVISMIIGLFKTIIFK